MTITTPELHRRTSAQKIDLPQIYGSIDFDTLPFRFTTDLDVPAQMRPELESMRARLLANEELVARIAGYTMLGDRYGDAYAALMGERGFKPLVDMLVQACDHGLASVEDAPQELVDLIHDMEHVPAWIDLGLVRRGAELDRLESAFILPFVIRGALLGTFMNTYAALPMAITGALSERTAGKRANETAAFFISSVLPGALERDGAAFRSAAMVRLMHSMVRFNIMKRSKWDSSVYGVPIPQADQMPAGFMPAFLLAVKALQEERPFTEDERARVEFSRYRCYLLGVPEDLLPTEPRAILETMATRSATLRQDFDDDTCGRLVRATMSAEIERDQSRMTRFRTPFERSASKIFLVKNYLDGEEARAEAMGVPITRADRLRAAVTFGYIAARVIPFGWARRVPGLRVLADLQMVRTVEKVLRRYSGAEFETDASSYAHHGTKAG